jgi:hypothetical protein
MKRRGEKKRKRRRDKWKERKERSNEKGDEFFLTHD